MNKVDDTYEMLDLGSEPVHKPIRWILLAVLLVAGFSGGLVWWQLNKPSTVNTAGPLNINQPAPVQTQPLPAKEPRKTVTETILFDEASATIRADQMTKLELFYNNISSLKGSVNLNGYTDDLGSEQEGLLLSRARAASVAEIIQTLSKHSPNYKYNIQGFGESNPIGDNRTESGRAKNRRVDMEFVPNP